MIQMIRGEIIFQEDKGNAIKISENIIDFSYLSSVVICISLIRQAAIIPVVVLPRPIWSEKMHGALAGSFFRASTIMSKLSSPADLSSVTGILK